MSSPAFLFIFSEFADREEMRPCVVAADDLLSAFEGFRTTMIAQGPYNELFTAHLHTEGFENTSAEAALARRELTKNLPRGSTFLREKHSLPPDELFGDEVAKVECREDGELRHTLIVRRFPWKPGRAYFA